MAKKTQPPLGADKPKPQRRQVVLDAELAKKIGIIASALELTVPDYVNNRLKRVVDNEYPAVMNELGFTPKPKE